MVKIGSQESYKCIRTEGSKVWHNDIHKNVSNCHGSSLTSRQYSSTVISEHDGGSQQDYFEFSQENMGLSFSKWNHEYCAIPAWRPQPIKKIFSHARASGN